MPSDLITKAAGLKKPTKTKAQEIIKLLADACPEFTPQLAELYTWFMPPIPKKPKTDWDWVAQAAGKKDIRDYFDYVYVTTTDIVASDGHRLHKIPNTDNLPVGYYLANGDYAHDPDWRPYPDYSRVIPAPGKAQTYAVEQCETHDISNKIVGVSIGKTCVNRQYLLEALAGRQHFTAQVKDKNTAVRIDDGDRLAVVMPIRTS